MADDKKNIPNAGKVDEPAKAENTEPMKADPAVPEQPAPSKPETPAVGDAPKAAVPPAVEKSPALGAEQPAPSKENKPQPGKTDQQVTIPGMGDPTPAGKVVDFTAARDGTAKGKPPEKAAAPDKSKQPEASTRCRGRPPKDNKSVPGKTAPRDKKSQGKGAGLSTSAKKKDSRTSDGGKTPTVEPKPPLPEQPSEPRDATRPVKEEIVYLDLSELHAFKDHPFEVRDDAEMQALVESVKTGGVNQPALVRPREGGGYEIVAGHRRQKASELAGYRNMPCIVRNMTDEEAILTMTDDNLRHSINPFSALAAFVLGRIEILIYRYIEHCHHLIKGVEAGVLAIILVIHDGTRSPINNIGQLLLRHPAGLPRTLDGEPYIVKVKPSFISLYFHNIT